MAKQIKVREDNYFAVQGWMVTELKLKGNALMLYAIIYGFFSINLGTTYKIRQGSHSISIYW